MALKSVSGSSGVSSTVKAAKMEVGTSVSGYLKKIEESQQYPGQFSLILVDKESGKTFRLSGAGNIKYIVADGLLTEGLFTQVTRLPDAKTKKGLMSSKFDIAQDDEDVLANANLPTPAPEAAATEEGDDIPDLGDNRQARVAAAAAKGAANAQRAKELAQQYAQNRKK